MQATVEKTIHFNCPHCHEPVEAPAAASGRLISCPSCGREFDSPRPAPKASPSWLVVAATGLVAALILAAIPVKDWAARRADWARTHESPTQVRRRFQSEADAALTLQSSVAIVGLRSVINRDLRNADDNPANWTAEVTADYINPVGGVERTTLPFRFWTYHSPVDGRDHVLCAVDQLKISQAQNDALTKQFGLTATAAAQAAK